MILPYANPTWHYYKVPGVDDLWGWDPKSRQGWWIDSVSGRKVRSSILEPRTDWTQVHMPDPRMNVVEGL